MSMKSPTPHETISPDQMLLPGSLPLHVAPKDMQEVAKTVPVRKTAAKQEIVWIDPKLLQDHPANVELFGENRLCIIDDLTISLEIGFDQNRPIKAIRRPDGSTVMLDGHRRQRAALELGHERVPVLFASFSDDKEERLEMLTANLVRNRKYRSVGLGTAVRLIQTIRPREIKRGRPSKENKARGTGISPEDKREYYARLLGISAKKFRMADYVLRHGTKEEKLELDTGPRSTSAIYGAVHARVTKADLTPAVTPNELAKMARDAARAAAYLLGTAGLEVPFKTNELEANIDSLLNYARLEAGAEADSGTTALEEIKLLRAVLGQAEVASRSSPLKLTA
jgi:hypothetical protein